MALVEYFYRNLATGPDQGAPLRGANLDLIKEFHS